MIKFLEFKDEENGSVFVNIFKIETLTPDVDYNNKPLTHIAMSAGDDNIVIVKGSPKKIKEKIEKFLHDEQFSLKFKGMLNE